MREKRARRSSITRTYHSVPRIPNTPTNDVVRWFMCGHISCGRRSSESPHKNLLCSLTAAAAARTSAIRHKEKATVLHVYLCCCILLFIIITYDCYRHKFVSAFSVGTRGHCILLLWIN